MKPATAIASWKDWPRDVVWLLRKWNHERRLSFPYTQGFTCCTCWQACEPNQWGDAQLNGEMVCDGCLIEAARKKVTP